MSCPGCADLSGKSTAVLQPYAGAANASTDRSRRQWLALIAQPHGELPRTSQDLRITVRSAAGIRWKPLSMTAAFRARGNMNYAIRKRILVTGAGFLARTCVSFCSPQADVICLDNFFTGTKDNIAHLLDAHRPHAGFFELMRHDVTFPLYVEVDEIYNLACPASPSITSTIGADHQDQCAGRSTCWASRNGSKAGIFQASTSGSTAIRRCIRSRRLLGQRESDRSAVLLLRRRQALRGDAVLRLPPPARASTSRLRGSSAPTVRGCIPTMAGWFQLHRAGTARTAAHALW